MPNQIKHRIEFKAKKYAKYTPPTSSVLVYTQNANGSLKLITANNLKLLQNE